MKKPFLETLTAIALCFVGFSSCGVDDTAEDAVPRLKVDQNRVELIRTGTLSSGATATLTITANKGYNVTSDAEWLSVDKPTGRGAVNVSILAEKNESGAVRKGLLTITSGSNLSETITVVQNLEEDRDDHMPVGHIYFNDDFAWCVGGTDDVGSQTIGDARNIYTWNYEANGFTNSLPTFQSLYEDLNSNAKTVYTMNGYIKFDKTNTITAIAIRNLGIAAEKSTNVKVSFRCARYNTDKTTVVVAIEGEGSIDGGSQAGTRIVSAPVAMSADKLTWSDVSVNIRGISSKTKIIIGEQTYVKDGINNSGTFRWYMDDLKVERIER
ncbi:BACON domain-containing protein [Duncaniella muris]|uniref:BACON domain-containing protein n=1 Tax=Duncaniella muris TaxID=2094150 RepID=UPI0025A9413C|nr:BACON domain-containing protein [Duncaniella muris]